MFDHDKLCMGAIVFGICDCAMIKKVRNDQHLQSYNQGFVAAKTKYKAKYKRKLKKIKDNEAR